MSEEIDAETTVYVASTDRRVVHTDPDCHHLASATVTAYERGEFPDLDVCANCQGTVEHACADPWETVSVLDDLDPEDVGLDPLVE